MKLPYVEDDNDDLNDSIQELLANIAVIGVFMFIIGIGILLWYLYIY